MNQRFPARLIAPVKLLFQSPKKIVITTHHGPDGDAMGSSLGLFNYLIQKNQKVKVVVPSEYPEFLKWLPSDKHVLNYELDTSDSDKVISEAEIIFCLDFNQFNRTKKMSESLRASSAIKILIDHHLEPENVFDHAFSFPEASSTCELVYEFILGMSDGPLINKNVAECLYTGIMTDTNSFRYEAMTSETHRTIARLMETGMQNHKIHEQVYDTNSEHRLRLLGLSLKDKLVVLKDFNTAYISLSEEELNSYHFMVGDTEGFVNYALSIKGIKLAAFFSPKNNEVRISFRSKDDFSVQEIASKYFEGGGHRNAAGGKSLLSMDEAIKKFISILPEYKSQLA